MHRIQRHSLGGLILTLVSMTLMASAALPWNTASAATVYVMNCNDSGAGSLRASIATAHSGDTIDLTTVPCRRIVLTSGQIVITQDDLKLVGPGSSRLTVDGNHRGRVFLDTGISRLVIKSMGIANGYFSLPLGSPEGTPRGGCIKTSLNTVVLDGVDLHGCVVEALPHSFNENGEGGGLYAIGEVRIRDSHIYSNAAPGGEGGGVFTPWNIVVYHSHFYGNDAFEGGGLGSRSSVLISHSTFSGNSASAVATQFGPHGAGAYVWESLWVVKSTVSRNWAVRGTSAGVEAGRVYVCESTFSGNRADGGSALSGGPTTIFNSTIAYNRTRYGSAVETYQGPVHITSSIIANNRGRSFGNDISRTGPDEVYATGSHNLIQSSLIPVPADTLSADPMLAPLANNGGPTKTHALRDGSPAIDRGSNPRHFRYDQRGVGFERVKGGAADMGALEH